MVNSLAWLPKRFECIDIITSEASSGINYTNMAQQTGILKLKGPIGGLSFYHHKHYGWLARQSNPVDPQRIRKDPAFARMRENMSEFGRASSAGRLMRHGLREFLREIGTEFLDNRTMKLMMEIKNEDFVSERGKRNVSAALASKPELLGDFELHFSETLFRFTGQHPLVDKVAGTVSLKDFTPFHAPKAATHVALTAFRGRLDFEMDERDFVFSETKVYPLDGVERDVILSVESQSESGVEIWGMKVVYMQEVNGELYSLKVGAAKIIQSDSGSGSEGLIEVEPMEESGGLANGLITNYELENDGLNAVQDDGLADGTIDCVAAFSGANDLITNYELENYGLTAVQDDGLADGMVSGLANGTIWGTDFLTQRGEGLRKGRKRWV